MRPPPRQRSIVGSTIGLTGSKTEYLSQISTVVGAVRGASGRSVRIATGTYCFHGLGSAGISMEVPSGSIRKSGGEPGKGAGGPSSTKHAICKSREGRLAPSEETNVTPARSRVITEIAPPRLSPNSDLGASANPAFSRYQRTDLSISDTNTMTLGVVGAAIVHGPSSASARRVKVHSINRNKVKNNADVDGYPFWAMVSCGRGCDLRIGRAITQVGRR